jgi:hypothetical protein
VVVKDASQPRLSGVVFAYVRVYYEGPFAKNGAYPFFEGILFGDRDDRAEFLHQRLAAAA